MVFIECSDQKLRLADYLRGTAQGNAARGPTGAEMTAEIDAAVSHGATGIVYFPDVIGAGWLSFDGTTAEITAAMPAINARIAKIAPSPLADKMVTIDGFTYTLRAH